jgi:hypothetical protein
MERMEGDVEKREVSTGGNGREAESERVIPSGVCVRKNPVSEGWQSWKESKETGPTFRKNGVLRLYGNNLPYPLAWLPRPLADNACLSEMGR